MRVIDCECGAVVGAANDDDLVERFREHLVEHHPETDRDDEKLRSFVADNAYTATDS
jgi:hypothetical protein